ncbi:MAG TPA: beta-ketoacyl-ACP synthase III [Symbiobacteriaceae bacterium]|nr:beta-ketoacyl-ACP synthase III [Symbiobacteriaceae bacterium]
MIQNVKLLGTGTYLPKRLVTAAEIDQRIQAPSGWTMKKAGVAVRHFVQDETASQMGALAAAQALQNAGLKATEIDCIVAAASVGEQPIPCSAALLQEAMGLADSGIPCFDINSTCLSFLVALDLVSHLVTAGRYRRVLIVSSEIASVGLDWSDKESAALFGDGAAAVVIGPSAPGESSRILGARLETYSRGAHLSEIRGGGTRVHPRIHSPATAREFLFSMDGTAIFKLASRLMPDFLGALLEPIGCTVRDLKLVIPHQASAMAMRLLQRKLGVTDAQLMNIVANHGNTIAASIPMGLHEAIVQGRLQRGDRALLIGTSAGLSLGGLVLDY